MLMKPGVNSLGIEAFELTAMIVLVFPHRIIHHLHGFDVLVSLL